MAVPLCSGEIMQDVTDLSDKIVSLTAASTQVLDSLELISTSAEKLMQVTVPAGALVLALFNKMIKPESDEMAALRKLHRLFRDGMSKVGEQINDGLNEVQLNFLMANYINEVYVPLKIITSDMTNSLDQTKRSIDYYKQLFKSECTSIRSPKNLLTWMEANLVDQCEFAQQTQIEHYVRGAAIFDKLETQLGETRSFVEDHDHFAYWRSDFLYRITDLQKGSAEKMLVALEKEYRRFLTLGPKSRPHDIQTFLMPLQELLRKMRTKRNDDQSSQSSTSYPCLLKAALYHNDYLRKPLYDLADIIRRDLVRIMVTGTICTQIIAVTESGETAKEISDDLRELTVKISKHVSGWIAHHLQISWPTLMSKMAESVARKMDLKDHYSWNTTAANIRDTMNDRGPHNFEHQVLITPPWDNVQWFIARYSFDYAYLNFKLEGKINLFVSRHQRGDETWKQASYAHEVAKPAHEKLSHGFEKNWKSKDMAKLLGDMMEETGLLQHYGSAVLVHNSKVFSTSCVINTGTALKVQDGVPFSIFVSYYANPWYRDCEVFKLFLML